MTRLYKVGKSTKIMTGEEVIAYAERMFWTKDALKSAGGQPTTVSKAIKFVSHVLQKPMYTRLESECDWVVL